MNTLKNLLIAAILVVAFSASGFAQGTTYQTVLTAAVSGGTGNQRIFSVASTGTAGNPNSCSPSTQTTTYWIFVDGELGKIQSVSGSNLSVTGGVNGTRQTGHPNYSVVWCGATGGYTGQVGVPFTSVAPIPNTACTPTNYAYLPIINVSNGTQNGEWYNCIPLLTNLAAVGVGNPATGNLNGSGRWITFSSIRTIAFNHPVTPLNDAAYSASLVDEFINFLSLTTGRTITLPAITGILGKTIVIKNSTVNTSTITIQTSSTQGMNSNSGTGSTSMTMSGPGAITRLISVITGAGGWGWTTW